MNAVLVPPPEQIHIRTFPFLIMDVFHLPPRGSGCREATGKNGATGRVPSAGSAHNLSRLHVLDLVHWLKSPQSAATLSPPPEQLLPFICLACCRDASSALASRQRRGSDRPPRSTWPPVSSQLKNVSTSQSNQHKCFDKLILVTPSVVAEREHYFFFLPSRNQSRN